MGFIVDDGTSARVNRAIRGARDRMHGCNALERLWPVWRSGAAVEYSDRSVMVFSHPKDFVHCTKFTWLSPHIFAYTEVSGAGCNPKPVNDSV